MQFDRNAVNRMLRLDDGQLRQIIARLADEAGIDRAALNLSAGDLQALRQALGSASDQELTRLAEQLESQKNGGSAHGR